MILFLMIQNKTYVQILLCNHHKANRYLGYSQFRYNTYTNDALFYRDNSLL